MEDRDRIAANDRLTRKERRKKLWILAILVLLLAAVGLTTWFLTRDRGLPTIATLPQGATEAPPTYVFSINGNGKNALSSPLGVAVARNGDVYVADFDKRQISRFARTGEFKSAFSAITDGKETRLRAPVNVASVGDEIWVTDRRLRAIYVFSLDGQYRRKIEPKTMKNVWTPLALDAAADGQSWITDVGQTDKHRIVRLSKDGTKVEKMVGKTAQVNDPKTQPGVFYFPAGITIASDGTVFVSDGDNRRVQAFDKDGKFVRFINTSGVPRGIDVDTKNRVYVVDALAHNVTVYTPEGKTVVSFGQQGFGPGQFNFPNGLAVGPDQRIYISDRVNGQVQVWEWPAAVVPSAGALARSPYLWLLLLLLLIPPLWWLLRRKKRYVVTPEFVDALIAAEQVALLAHKRSRFVAPEFDRAKYEGRVVDEVDLGEVIHLEEYSPSDAAVVRDRFTSTEEQAAYLVMGERAKALLTDDGELTSMAMTHEIRVIDSRMFIASRKQA